MKHFVFRLIPALSGLALSVLGRATILDFEGLSGTNFGTYIDYGTSVSTKGYIVAADDQLSSGGLISWTPGSTSNGYANYTGSTALFEHYTGNQRALITKADGGAFDLLSLDVANLYTQSSSSHTTNLTFRGNRSDGSTVTQSYTTTSDNARHTVTFLGFTNLASLTFQNSDPSYCQFDNVTVNPVSEPAPFVALGFGALALVRRRKR